MNLSKSDKIGFVLVFVIFALLYWTLSSTSVTSLKPSDLGLTSQLPIAFWIGLVLIGGLFFFGRKNKTLLVFGFIFAMAYLYFAPAVIKIPPWLSNSFYPFGESKLINSVGHLVNRPGAPLYSYLDWPIFLYLSSALSLVTGIPDVVLVKFFPVLTMTLYGALTFLILKVRLNPLPSILGSVWFVASFWLRQHYFGPQSIAYVYYLLLLLIVAWIFFSEKPRKNRYLEIVFLFLSLVLTLTHVLTSFFLLITLAGLYFSRRFIIKRTSREVELLSVFSVIFLSYNLFLAPDFFNFGVERILGGLAEIGSLSLYSEPNRIVGSFASRVNYYSSLLIIAINVVIAVVALVVLLRKFSLKRSEKLDVYSILWATVLVFFGIFALTAQYGHHEGYQRAFMFGLVPLTFLCINLLKKHKKILIVLTVFLMLLNIPAQYGADSFRLATNTELAGAEFLAVYMPEGSSCFNELSFYVRYFNPEKAIAFRSLIALPMTEYPNRTAVIQSLNEVEFITRSELQDNYYLHYLSDNPLDQVDFSNFNKIYDNGKFSVYTHTNQSISLGN